jgi:hypothetical protein
MRNIADAALAGDADAAARACSRHLEEAGRVGLQALVEHLTAGHALDLEDGPKVCVLRFPATLCRF